MLVIERDDEIGWSESALSEETWEMIPIIGYESGYLTGHTRPEWVSSCGRTREHHRTRNFAGPGGGCLVARLVRGQVRANVDEPLSRTDWLARRNL